MGVQFCAMARKEFTIVVVRHGQATHNLETFQRKDLVLTDEPDTPIMNSPLTDVGQAQARLVAARLAETKFDLGFASDLVRAWDTAKAIVAANLSLESVKECRYLRERNAGDFEYNSALSNAQYTVEEGVEDRDLLTWRIPGGDSIFDLSQSVRACLHLVQVEALALKEEKPTIFLVSHYVWMHELYNVLAEISEALGNEKKEKKAKLPTQGWTGTFSQPRFKNTESQNWNRLSL